MVGDPNPPKRLLLFFDGTANSAAQGRWSDATNIFRVNLALHYAGNQISFYMPGVGTYSRGGAAAICSDRDNLQSRPPMGR
jgi:uncharacterized protein (DUF2235 family)